ncbi:MAG: hypothetical protein ACLP9D_01940 [Candidatus Bathyarchaeia archaeon]
MALSARIGRYHGLWERGVAPDPQLVWTQLRAGGEQLPNSPERDKDEQSFLLRWAVIDNLEVPPPDYLRGFDCPKCGGHASELLFLMPDLSLQINYNCYECTTSKHLILHDDKIVWLATKGKGAYVVSEIVKDPLSKNGRTIWRRYLWPLAAWASTYESFFQAYSATSEEDARLGEIQLRQNLDLFGSPVVRRLGGALLCCEAPAPDPETTVLVLLSIAYSWFV